MCTHKIKDNEINKNKRINLNTRLPKYYSCENEKISFIKQKENHESAYSSDYLKKHNCTK